MISINNISFAYGEKEILNDFSLNIENGNRLCFFGESGYGKTTLLRLISGLEKPQKGEIKKDGNLKIAAVFQENRLLPFKTVMQNITLIGADETTAQHHLNALGIGDTADKYPSELSGGMKRRAAIARALSSDYDILILDEPFAGLDSGNISSAAEHINKTLKNKTLLLVTHSKEEAEMLNTKIITL